MIIRNPLFYPDTTCNSSQRQFLLCRTRKYYEREARKHLRTALERSNINELDDAITRVQRLKLDSEGDLREAKKKRELLILERDLRLAIARRRPDFLEQVLERASRLSGEHHLDYLVREALDVKEQLRRLVTFLHDVLEINQPTISEMHNHKLPKDIIHDIMIATYLLLGEDIEDLRVGLSIWDYIQHLMRKVGRNSLISRLRSFDVVNVQLDVIEKVQNILDLYDEETVTQASAFYVWCQNIAVELTVSLHNEIQKYRTRRG